MRTLRISIAKVIYFYSIIFLISICTIEAQNNTLNIGNIKADPGQKVSDSLYIEKGVDKETFIPITIINGVKEGPVLTLIAGIHGTEYVPIIVLQKLINEIDPKDLSGSMIIVHVASVESFQKRTMYFNPVDFKNVNRVFPGNKNGTQTERIAYTITHEIIDKSDYLIDMHGGEENECFVNFALFYQNCPNFKVCEGSYLLARSFGLEYLFVEDYNFIPDTLPSKYCELTALRRGIPAIALELGGQGIIDEELADLSVAGIINVMKAINMIEGNVKEFKPHKYLINYAEVYSKYQGVHYSEVSCGQIVSKGELLGYTTDLFGNKLEELYSPITGMVISAHCTPPVNVDEQIYWLAEISDNF
jgi:hypothetical protein